MPGSRSANSPERRLPRGRHDLPREFVARTQRDRLIDAMARTVAARGYAATSLGEVCTAAGVSTKAFYQHFTDKEACFLATFERGVGLLQKCVANEYAQPGPWPERMRRGLGTLLSLLAAEPAFASLAVVQVLAAGPRALACRRSLLASFGVFFSAAPSEPGVPPAPPTLVEAVVAGVYGVIFDFVSEGRCTELPDQLPELTYFILAPFLGPEVAARTAGLPRRTDAASPPARSSATEQPPQTNTTESPTQTNTTEPPSQAGAVGLAVDDDAATGGSLAATPTDGA